MIVTQILRPILDDEGLTRGLSDPEARILIEWLVDQAECLERRLPCDDANRAVKDLCKRARAISKFVALWHDPQSRGAACQLAAVERFPWPLPTGDVDPCELMLDALTHEPDAADLPVSNLRHSAQRTELWAA